MMYLLIRGLRTELHRELKRRADLEHMSLQGYVTTLLERHASQPSLQQWLRDLDELPAHPDVSGANAVRQARDELP